MIYAVYSQKYVSFKNNEYSYARNWKQGYINVVAQMNSYVFVP